MISSEENKYIKQVSNMMFKDLALQPLKQKWALLSRLGYFEVWESQGVGNMQTFLNIFKQRMSDVFDWHSRLQDSTRARCYLTFAKFLYQKYFALLNIVKYRKSLSRL